MTRLPRLMVAPNGARLGKSDHPAIPLTLDEIIDTARACHAAGADGLHLHLRDGNSKHVLDNGLYREALSELSRHVPELIVQVTTESVGMYSSDHQRHVALTSGAKLVSTSIREIMQDTSPEAARTFFEDAVERGIAIQFILYDTADAKLLKSVLPSAMYSSRDLQILFVLGRYSATRDSSPSDLTPFLTWMAQDIWTPDWAVCAFGRGETDCLEHAYSANGKLRVGFENSIWSRDGTVARDNAQRVREISNLIHAHDAA